MRHYYYQNVILAITMNLLNPLYLFPEINTTLAVEQLRAKQDLEHTKMYGDSLLSSSCESHYHCSLIHVGQKSSLVIYTNIQVHIYTSKV